MRQLSMCLLAVMLSACVDDERTTRVLSDQGYTRIRMTGHSWSGCADDDHYCTGFEARSPSGRRVKGAVGCGLAFKGCTIRID